MSSDVRLLVKLDVIYLSQFVVVLRATVLYQFPVTSWQFRILRCDINSFFPTALFDATSLQILYGSVSIVQLRGGHLRLDELEYVLPCMSNLSRHTLLLHSRCLTFIRFAYTPLLPSLCVLVRFNASVRRSDILDEIFW